MTTEKQKYSRKYKDKYADVKDIYDIIKPRLSKRISYKRYYAIISSFFKALLRGVITRGDVIHLPNRMGYIYLDKREHQRAFHYRIDLNETNRTGEKVIYKVPILDDYYHKIMWIRPLDLKRCKIMPLAYGKKLIKSL